MPTIDPSQIKAETVVNQTLDNLAADTSVNLSQTSADNMKASVTKEITAVVKNQTNQEPWWASTVTLTAMGSVVVAGYALGYDFLDGTIPTPAEFAPQALAFVLPLGTLYGRWVQSKALWGQ